MSVKLKMMRVPSAVLSLKDGPSGEVLTGPGKPKPYDPGDLRWKAPALEMRGPAGALVDVPEGTPLDLCIDEHGAVLDVRFGRLDTPNAKSLESSIKKAWRFTPAQLDGSPMKGPVSTGGPPAYWVAPSKVRGPPVEASGESLAPPQVVFVVSLPAEVMT